MSKESTFISKEHCWLFLVTLLPAIVLVALKKELDFLSGNAGSVLQQRSRCKRRLGISPCNNCKKNFHYSLWKKNLRQEQNSLMRNSVGASLIRISQQLNESIIQKFTGLKGSKTCLSILNYIILILYRKSILTDLEPFDITKQMPEDVMHILLEGVVPLHVGCFLKKMIDLGLVQLKTFNSALQSFPYGHLEIANKPVPITEDSVNNEDLTGKQSGELHSHLSDTDNYFNIYFSCPKKHRK